MTSQLSTVNRAEIRHQLEFRGAVFHSDVFSWINVTTVRQNVPLFFKVRDPICMAAYSYHNLNLNALAEMLIHLKNVSALFDSQTKSRINHPICILI